jgi:putative Mn2+ efflux pump MntP
MFIITGLLLGLDSFLVSVGIGTLPTGWVRRYRLAIAFALCDGLASGIGSLFHADWREALEWSEWLGPAAVAAYGLYVLVLAWKSQTLIDRSRGAWLAIGLPICLSLDNLAVGVDATEAGVPVAFIALAFGAVSGLLSLLGSALGASIGGAEPRRQWLGGAVLLVLACGLFCKEMLF